MVKKIRWLKEPIQVGSLRLRNRMVYGPMHSNMNMETGEVSQQIIDIYQHAAKHGTSLIVIEATAVDGRHTWPVQLRIDSKEFEPGLHRLVEAIHVNGVPVAVQIHHGGMYGKDPVSPSGVPSYTVAQKYLPTGAGGARYLQPRVMTLAEIEEARELFIRAAERARSVEFDGVVIHGSTSYLLEQFVSPHTNRRTDQYGGSFENRIALPLEVVRGVRQRCGPRFPVGYSLVADELYPDGEGITLEASVAFARALEREGVDWIDLMAGNLSTYKSDPRGGTSYRQLQGLFEFSGAFKKAVSIPVFARCAGEHDPMEWEAAIAKGQCDVIQMARPMLCDPELPGKVEQGRLADIRLCIRDNYCYETGTEKGWQVSCALNTGWGDGGRAINQRTSAPRRVLVVGGGPAGLEAARVAALRGHQVTLMEKATRLGGNLRIAALCPGKEDYQAHFGEWLERQCRKAGVDIQLGTEATPQIVRKSSPDVVIVATGATPLVPAMPGIDKKHVVMAADVLAGQATVGKRVVVAGGGGIGVDVADYVTSRGLAQEVTIVEMTSRVAADMYAVDRTYMLETVLPQAGVKILTDMRVTEMTGEGLIAVDKDGKTHSLEADTVVVALGYVADGSLYEALKDRFPEVYRVGDCVRPRKIADATREAAYRAGQI